jgi:hypothetical protein
MANYIGKIAAVGTINMAQFSRGLDNSAKDVDRFAKRISSTLSSANSAAARSFDQIFTPIQRLERAIQARSRDRLNIDTGGAEEKLRAIVGAAEDIARPLGSSAKAFSGLSATIQNEFIGSLVQAQEAAATTQAEISRGAIKGAQDYERYKRVVDETVISIRRLSEAGAAVSGLASGQELRFQQAGLQSELQRAAAIQGQAGSLPASARNSRGNEIARIVALQQREAEEAARLLAILENIRNTRSEDYAAIARAQGALDGQVQRLGEVNSQLERQTRLVAELQALTSAGPRGNELIFTNPGVARELRSSAALRQAASEAADPSQFSGLLAQLNQAEDLVAQYQLEVQQRPRLGVDADDAVRRLEQARETARRVREEIKSSLKTESPSTRGFQLLDAPPQQRGLGLFGGVTETETEQAIARARRLSDEYAKLPEKARLGLATLAGIARNVSDRVEAGTANASRLNDVLDRLEPGISAATAAADDQRRRREVATALLPPIIDQPTPDQTNLEPNRARNRILQNLGGEIDVVRRRLRELPDIGATLGPGVDNLNNRFRLLARQGVAFTAEQARELQRQIAAVAAALNTRASLGQQFLGQFGGEGIAGLGLGVDQQSLRAAGGQIEFVQQRLSRLAAEARGPTLQALENFRQVAQRLFDAGTIDTESGRAELAALRRELAATLSAAGGGSQGRILGDLNRSGDIARGGIDRFSLGLQQAAFAVDDFFSVTGGFEQRIRAIGNNLTQLGFIVGGTSGLFVALGVSVGAQAIAGIVRFINSGQAAEDQTKALNDALERQRNLVEQLAQSFSNLADSITTRGFSSAAKEARQLTRDLESLIKVQRDAREERLVSANPRGREIDGQINSLNRRLRDVTDAGQAAALRDQIGGLQDERRRLRQELPNRPAPTRTEVANSIGFRGFQSTAALLQGVFLDTIGTIASLGVNQIVNSGNTAPRIGADSARAAGLIDPNNTLAIRAAIDARIREINPLASQDIGLVSTFGGDNRNILAAREERARLQELQARFSDSAFDDALKQYVESVNSATRGFEAAQNEVTQAIEAGVPGARSLGVIIDTLSSEIDNANKAIEAAINEFNANPTAPGAAERRDAILATQQEVIDRTRAQRSAVEAESDRLRRERTLNPSRQIEAVIGRTQDAIDRIGSAAGFQQARLRDLQFQRETVQQQLRAAPADPVLIRTEQDLNNAIRSLEAEVTALDETMNGFEAREARRLLGDPERGRQLAMTPGERAAEETQQGINDIIARFGEIAAETTGLVDVRARDEAINRFLGDRIRQEAPLIAGFSDEVANALLQGPSRAALQASDASTLQGQQELNRLLRGEDPARDVNLVELQKQTQALNELVQIGRAGPQVAP